MASEFRELSEANTISLQSVQTSSGPHSPSNLTGSRRCLPGGQSGRDVKLTNHLQVPEAKNNYICTSTHSSVCMARRWTILLCSYIFWTVVSTVRYMTSSDLDYDERQSVNTCRETVVAYFKALFRTSKAEPNKKTKNLSGGTTVEIRNKHLQNTGQKQ